MSSDGCSPRLRATFACFLGAQANMLCFLFLYLARNPVWKHRVLEEIRTHLPEILRGDRPQHAAAAETAAGKGEEAGGGEAPATEEAEWGPSRRRASTVEDDSSDSSGGGSSSSSSKRKSSTRDRARVGGSTGSPSNDRLDVFHMLGRLRVLEACLLETLRLKPSAPLRSRQTTADVQIGEHTIPRGTLVGWSPYTLHRLPSLWENPSEWDPSRFLRSPNSKTQRSRSSHVGVGGDSRRGGKVGMIVTTVCSSRGTRPYCIFRLTLTCRTVVLVMRILIPVCVCVCVCAHCAATVTCLTGTANQ